MKLRLNFISCMLEEVYFGSDYPQWIDYDSQEFHVKNESTRVKW